MTRIMCPPFCPGCFTDCKLLARLALIDELRSVKSIGGGGLVVVRSEVFVSNSGRCRTLVDAPLLLAIASARYWW